MTEEMVLAVYLVQQVLCVWSIDHLDMILAFFIFNSPCSPFLLSVK